MTCLLYTSKIDAIREAIKELERAGYIVRARDVYKRQVQGLGSDTHKIPVVAVLNPGRLPLAPHEYVKALAAMQAPVVAV